MVPVGAHQETQPQTSENFMLHLTPKGKLSPKWASHTFLPISRFSFPNMIYELDRVTVGKTGPETHP